MRYNNISFLFPDTYDSNAKGNFFEQFVASLIEPMRYKVTSRIRYTGMEIDLLAKGCDQPKTIYIECKALKENISADVITKLIGNVWANDADEGWLFSTSDLSKDAKGLNENIKTNIDKARKFTWYGPEKILDILFSQKIIQKPETIPSKYQLNNVGDFTLLVLPDKFVWLLELIENNISKSCILFDAQNGNIISDKDANRIKSLDNNFKNLKLYNLDVDDNTIINESPTQDIARVMSGDSWDDLRPSKPKDFVGRDMLIQEILNFITSVQFKKTQTRNFAIVGPSGWGKSSLVLKISDISNTRKLKNCSVTAIDTRSATNLTFVNEAILTALKDAQQQGIIPNLIDLKIDNTSNPLSSQSIEMAFDYINNSNILIVLVFDQFEELFYKEELLEIFNKIKELSFAIDAKQLPILLGFAWKTDVTLPQEHPAYHLWHLLEDRRKKFTITEFGRKDILSLILKAEKETNIKFSKALKDRLIEQCQGLPWLLKKLLVHTVKKIKDNETQYMLLDRELDLKELFDEDLSLLNSKQIEAIEYIAQKSPISISEAEKRFNAEDLNALVSRKLILISGLNYVIYWDIFRDYVKDKKVPNIPWNKIFQKEPKSCIKIIKAMNDHKSYNIDELVNTIGITKGTLYNTLNDLLSLQLVEQTYAETYKLSKVVEDIDNQSIAKLIQKQLKKHIVYIKLKDLWKEEQLYSFDDFEELFVNVLPQTMTFSNKTKTVYSVRFLRWLYFASLIDINDNKVSLLCEKCELGRNLRLTRSCLPNNNNSKFFRAATSPKDLLSFINYVYDNKYYFAKSKLYAKGVLEDARALGLIITSDNKKIILADEMAENIGDMENYIKEKVQSTSSMDLFISICREITDAKIFKTKNLISYFLVKGNPNWKFSSAKRIWGGLKIYYIWLKYNTMDTRTHKLSISDFE